MKGECREVCTSDEKPEQGAFIDCTDTQHCCVRKEAANSQLNVSALVVIDQFAFSPDVIKIKAGTQVVWKNRESTNHTVTADDGSFDSGSLGQGGEFKKTFTKPGTYSYSCEMHPFMAGKVVVE